tara:strand:+ start:167 stop:490 length:324 start_codon:yes stop_codon:yes gene_type:complete
MRVEYNGFVTNEFDTTSTNEEILRTFVERHLIFDPEDESELPRLIPQWPDLTFEDLTVTRTPIELSIIAKKYLADTDWYVARHSETGKAIPDDVLAQRAQARIDASN